MSFPLVSGLRSSDLAIDLGTANTLVFARGRGVVISEPSIVAINKATNNVEAVGMEAKQMLGRTPGNIVAIRPMRDGVIANFEVAEKMLQHFIRKAHNGKTWVSPRVVIGIPSGITQVERRAVEDSAYRAKASEVYLVEEAVAAAIGAGLPITEPHGHIVVDIGGGTTDIAVISLGGIVYSKAVRTAGDAMDDAISEFVKRKYNLLIGERTAEEIKMKLGSAFTFDEPLEMEVRGRNLVEGVPRTITIRDLEVREALDTAVSSIVDAVRVALERTPPELSADIIDRGIVLTGGGALLRNFDKRLQAETGLPVSVAEDPLTSVVVGAGKMLSDFALLKRVKWENTLKYE
jgi:rod shape-determining protein MreB